MAKQTGIIKVNGMLDDIVFYQSKDGYIMRKKGNLSANRVKTDSSFQRVRENGLEFGNAGKAGKLVRSAFSGITQHARDSRMTGRLVQELMKIVKTDATNARGQRTVANGELGLLEGFEFNAGAKLSTILRAPYVAAIDRPSGTLTVNFPSFVPIDTLDAPAGTTHFKVIAAGAEIDFGAVTHNAQEQESAMLPWTSANSGLINLSVNLTANSRLPLFLSLGVQFYQQVNGIFYALKDGSANAVSMIKVSAS